MPDRVEEIRAVSEILDEAGKKRWTALATCAMEWAKRVEKCTPAEELEEKIMLLHRALNAIAKVGPIPQGEGYHDTFEQLERMLLEHANALARLSWLEAGGLPEPPLSLDKETVAEIADRELNLRFFSELPKLIYHVEKAWSMLASGETPAELLYEMGIVCQNLHCRSGNRATSTLNRKLIRMLSLIAERGKVPDHELRLMGLEETFQRGLAVYKLIDVMDFVSCLHRLVGRKEPVAPRPLVETKPPAQLLAEQEEERLPKFITSPEDAALLLSVAIKEIAAGLGQEPLRTDRAELHCSLLKVEQLFHQGRRLPQEEIEKVASELSSTLSGLPDPLAEIVHKLGLYLRGKKIASRAAFAEVLSATIEEAQSKVRTFSYAELRPVWAAVARQLRAVRRWVSGGRIPSALERELTHQLLAESTRALEENKTERDFVRRLRELDTAFQDWETLQDDCDILGKIGPIRSHEEFLAALAEIEFDCHELGHPKLFGDPEPIHRPLIGIERKLNGMRRLCQKGIKSTAQERARILDVLADADKVDPGLCPTIPDFKEVLVADVELLVVWFKERMSSSDFATLEVRPLRWTGIQQLHLCPKNFRYLAFVLHEGKDSGLYRCGYEGFDAGRKRAGDLELELTRFEANQDELLLLVPGKGRRFADLLWEPTGYLLAYRCPDEGIVGWTGAGVHGMPVEGKEVDGAGFTWTSQGDALVFADPKAGKVLRLDIVTGQTVTITDLQDEGDPDLPPRLVGSPHGSRLAFTSRSFAAQETNLQIVEYRGRRPVVTLLRRVPDAQAKVIPFWLEADQLGAMIISPEQGTTCILSLPLDDSGEEVLYQSAELEPARMPAVSPSRRYVAFFSNKGLALMDRDESSLISLLPPGQVEGTPVFRKKAIVVHGEDAVHFIVLENFNDERLPLPSF